MRKQYLFIFFLIYLMGCSAQTQQAELSIKTGAEQIDRYLSRLKGKNVGLFVNHTSLVANTHLTDTLLKSGIQITKVFTPEHGFKGNLSDGELIENQETKKPFELVSLYGKSKKPTDQQIIDLDILVIDIQDVGVRFYTYASTMTYLMEACAKNSVPVLLLDRPNPNASYVDGPVLEMEHRSFVGMHPIPIVHGLTLGELALMINGEGWLENESKCELEVVPVQNWDHGIPYSLPVRPSPNLPNDLAIALYPSLALFEGTVVSVGRGTDHPFQIIGHPKYKSGNYIFTPQPNEGSKYPPLEGQKCYGTDLTKQKPSYRFTLEYLINYYQELEGQTEKSFFNNYFTRLAGTAKLQQQIEDGWSEEQIKKSWESELKKYKDLRQQYLIYKD